MQEATIAQLFVLCVVTDWHQSVLSHIDIWTLTHILQTFTAKNKLRSDYHFNKHLV